MRFFIISIFFFLNIFSLYSQDSTNLVKYDRNYKFKDGLYITFDNVRNNSPVPISNIITSLDKSSNEFFENLILQEQITIIDGVGVKKEYSPENVWGFAKEGKLYIYIDLRVNLIPVIGEICHFVGTRIVTYYPSSIDPFTYRGEPSTRVETRQFILDFSTGVFYDFTISNIEPIFAKDPDFYEEWVNLSNRKKKKLIFVYLRKYNDKHPLMMPKN